MSFAAVFVLAGSLLGQTAGNSDASITAVEGESWIRHLNRSFAETSMGKTWDLGPARPAGRGSRAVAIETIVRLRLSRHHACVVRTCIA